MAGKKTERAVSLIIRELVLPIANAAAIAWVSLYSLVILDNTSHRNPLFDKMISLLIVYALNASIIFFAHGAVYLRSRLGMVFGLVAGATCGVWCLSVSVPDFQQPQHAIIDAMIAAYILCAFASSAVCAVGLAKEVKLLLSKRQNANRTPRPAEGISLRFIRETTEDAVIGSSAADASGLFTTESGRSQTKKATKRAVIIAVIVAVLVVIPILISSFA